MIFNLLMLAIPLAIVLEYVVHVPPLVVFAVAIIAIIPLAEWIRRATENMAHTLGPQIGGLLNVTFGNMAEMLLAIFVLVGGHPEVVKAQITGAIIGNGLLGLGLAIVVGSWGREKQTFNRENAGRLSSLLILCVIALMVPALFDYTEVGHATPAMRSSLNEKLSLGVSVVLLIVYVANLVYTLFTHRDVYRAASEEEIEEVEHAAGTPNWSMRKSLGVLLGATALTAWMAELVSGALTSAAGALHVTEFFLGIIVLAVIGNAAEYVSAVYFARKDNMSLVMAITVGSSIQIALLVAPVLVVISYFIGKPMNLVFSSPLELIAIASVAFSVNAIAHDGESNWFEGLLLLAVYALFVLAFLFVTP
ncbi:MAG: calcium/proton exchanger [Longimicrobiales bacterium]